MNQRAFFFFNRIVFRSKLLDWLIIFLAKYLIFIFCLGYLFALTSAWFKGIFNLTQDNLIAIGGAGILGWTIALFIKWIRFTPRPYLMPNVKTLIKKNKKSPAFPSGHTALFMAAGSLSFFYSFWLGLILLLAGTLVGLARLTSGLHWPVDILGGAVLGWLISLVMYWSL
jgi:undecaprenyl-diphosphatase